MSFLVFDTEQEATSRSEQAALVEGIVGYTRIWSSRVEPNASRAALCVHGEYLHLLSTTEKSALVEELPADWNPPPPPFE